MVINHDHPQSKSKVVHSKIICQDHQHLKPESQTGKYQSLKYHKDRNFIFRFQIFRKEGQEHLLKPPPKNTMVYRNKIKINSSHLGNEKIKPLKLRETHKTTPQSLKTSKISSLYCSPFFGLSFHLNPTPIRCSRML